MKLLHIALAAAAASLLTACRKTATETNAGLSAPGTNTPVAASTNLQSYLVHGVVKRVNPAENKVTIQHEEIPKFMPAMTMPFNVKDAKELEGLAAGDSVWFRLWVDQEESWVDKITREKKSAAGAPEPAPAPSAPEREPVRVARDVEPLKVGDLMTNYTFTNELGRAIQLSDFKGQALAFTFIFTRCPIPEFCPRMSRNFSEAAQKLAALPQGPTNWHLLSISFDPHFDTPAVLQGYAKAFQEDARRWSFVTGAMIDIDAITDQFELTIIKRGNEWDHKVRTVVVDSQGRIQSIFVGNEWKPEALVEEMVKAARAEAPAAGG